MLRASLKDIGVHIDEFIRQDPATNVYGLARTLLAISLILTLSLTPFQVLLGHSLYKVPTAAFDVQKFSFFYLFSFLSRYEKIVAICPLVLVAIGWRPRYTGWLHWYLTFSFHISTNIPDGGDKIASLITLFLIPITLIDQRRTHWDAPLPARTTALRDSAVLAAWFSVAAIRIQVATIYLDAAIAKLNVPEWRDGTAVYYYFMQPTYGAPPSIFHALLPLLRHGWFVVLLTWGTLAFELLLFLCLAMPINGRKIILPLAILFHLVLATIHGIPSFSMIMFGALILYLYPMDSQIISIQRNGASSAWLHSRQRCESVT